MARRSTTRGAALALVAVGLTGLTGSAVTAPSATAVNETAVNETEGDRAERFESGFPDLGTNDLDQTYGAVRPSDIERGMLPDLVLLTGDSGEEGYVDSRALYPDPATLPTTPEEALAWNERHAADVVVPVFESEGVTQIDVYTIGGAMTGVS